MTIDNRALLMKVPSCLQLVAKINSRLWKIIPQNLFTNCTYRFGFVLLDNRIRRHVSVVYTRELYYIRYIYMLENYVGCYFSQFAIEYRISLHFRTTRFLVIESLI